MEIRDFFLEAGKDEVYDNIAQSLSLVQMKLGTGVFSKQSDLFVEGVRLNKFVGQSIRDLRKIFRTFFLDFNLCHGSSWHDALVNTLHVLFPGKPVKIHLNKAEGEKPPALNLIGFRVLQEILIFLKQEKRQVTQVRINCTSVKMTARITCEPLSSLKIKTDPGNAIVFPLKINRRIRLINGSLDMKRNKLKSTQVILSAPMKPS